MRDTSVFRDEEYVRHVPMHQDSAYTEEARAPRFIFLGNFAER